MAVPLTARTVDDRRARDAAGFLAGRLRAARQQALSGNRSAALVFDPGGPGMVFRLCSDGNGNGVRQNDIAAGLHMGTTGSARGAESLLRVDRCAIFSRRDRGRA